LSGLEANVRGLLRGKKLWFAAALTLSPVFGAVLALALLVVQSSASFDDATLFTSVLMVFLIAVPLSCLGYLWLFAAVAVRESWIGSRAPSEIVAWFCLLSLLLFLGGVFLFVTGYFEELWLLVAAASVSLGFLGCAIPFGRVVRRLRDDRSTPV
jgi:hypothetical protein